MNTPAEPAAWRPAAGPGMLAARGRCLQAIRTYFAAAAVTEVQTPVLCQVASSEPTLNSLAVSGALPARFLRTSPESALKRLLAAGSGDIYEIGPAFRGDEHGRLHATEFTLLEWYRLGYDHHRLMDDVDGVLAAVGFPHAAQRIPYSDIFREALGAVPEALDNNALAAAAARHPITLDDNDRNDRALLLDILYSHEIEPLLARRGAVFVYDFPSELRAYARLNPAPPHLAARFELLINGVEIANGYHEIIAAEEQRACFAAEAALRERRGLAAVEPDALWLAALAAGMPPAAGVALGIERLLLALNGLDTLADVMAFTPR